MLETKLKIEQHHTPQYLAAIWGCSVSTITRMFQDDDRVLKLSEPANGPKRKRRELRIPDSVACEAYAKRCKSQ